MGRVYLLIPDAMQLVWEHGTIEAKTHDMAALMQSLKLYRRIVR